MATEEKTLSLCPLMSVGSQVEIVCMQENFDLRGDSAKYVSTNPVHSAALAPMIYAIIA